MSYNKVGDVLKEIVKDIRMEEKKEKRNAWALVVGEKYQNLSSFKSLEKGVLTIECKNNSVKSLFLMNSRTILKNFNENFSEKKAEKLKIILS